MEDIIVEKDKILCLISGKYRKATPEEYIRQEYCRNLMYVYNYPKENIDVEVSIKIGRMEKRADIVVYNDSRKSQDNIYLIVETKKKQETEGIEQLISYMSASTAKFGVLYNGEIIKFLYNSNVGKFDDLPDIPKYKEDINAIGIYKKQSLTKCIDLKGVFNRCNNYFFVNQGLTQDKRFAEIIKVLFCKIQDEKDIFNENCNFYVTNNERTDKKGIKNLRERLNILFENVKDEFKNENIFAENDVINLNDRCLIYAVAELQKFSLLETNVDIKGVAFETFVGANLRGEHGEFFTPREIVHMATECIKPEINKVVCDPACGSGGFLVMVLKNIKQQLECFRDLNKDVNIEKLFSDYAIRYIRGIDFNPDLSRVAKMNMVLNEDGHSGIFHYDSLTPFEEWPEDIKKKIGKESVDIILTNPPFGKKCVIDDKKILSSFKLGHKWKLDGQRWIQTEKVDEKRTPDILFIERCLDLLKPGGRMAIVLPDGILGNDSYEFVRQFILDRAFLVAVIDCPVESFLPSTDTKTSLLIIKKKRSVNEQQTFNTYMAIPNKCGHDRRGKEIYKHDDNGEIILDDKNNPIIDNDYELITEELLNYVKNNNIYD